MGETLEVENLTWPETQSRLAENPITVLPIGATEQHGPHLPTGTDSFLAEEIARRVAMSLDALLLPTIPLSYSWVWRDYPGTLSLKVETVEAIVKDVARSLSRFGAKVLIVINGHGANESALKYATRDLADEIELDILYFYYPDLLELAKQVTTSPLWEGKDVHACEIETSLLLAVRPDLCRMTLAPCEYPPVPAHFRHSAFSMGALSNSGVFGDATAATPEKGRFILERTVARILESITYFLKQKHQGGNG